jgi:hypothetical protein
LCFAVAKSFLIVSADDRAVRETLRRASGEAPDNVTQNAAFQKATGELKPGYRALSWTDLQSGVEHLVRTVQSQPLLLMMLGRSFQMTQMPPAEDFGRFFGQLAAASYVSPEGYRSHLEVRYP